MVGLGKLCFAFTVISSTHKISFPIAIVCIQLCHSHAQLYELLSQDRSIVRDQRLLDLLSQGAEHLITVWKISTLLAAGPGRAFHFKLQRPEANESQE